MDHYRVSFLVLLNWNGKWVTYWIIEPLIKHKKNFFPEASVKNETFDSIILRYDVNDFICSILILYICSSGY
ncbi:hypothetical protein FZC70_19260 [Bacillus subtilis]|nr:hypothetical protein FZC70_19260 [Bacillus subtilis]